MNAPIDGRIGHRRTAAAPAIAALPPGLPDPVHDAQAVFRRLLDAMARPGHIAALPPALGGRLGVPAGLSAATAAVLLALADADTAVHAGAAMDERIAGWLRLHTGARLAASARDAGWLVADADDAERALADADPGSDEAPHTAATVVLEVRSLGAACEPALLLQGPGIDGRCVLHVGGPGPTFWQRRIAQQALFPCGADLILCCGERFAALPRSTRVQLLPE